MYVGMFKVVRSISDFVNYVMGKVDSEVIFSTILDKDGIPSDDPEVVVKHCEDFMKQYGKNALCHLIISCDDPKVGENKTLWRMLSQDVLEMMNMSHAPCVIALHRDGGSPHVHGLLTFFKIEFVLGEASYQEGEFERIPNQKFIRKYRDSEQKLKSFCINLSRDLEELHGLMRDTLNIDIGKDRYLKPEYSLKHHLRLAFQELLEKVTSFEEFLVSLPAICQKYLQTWEARRAHKSKSPMHHLIGNNSEVQCEITKSPVKQFDERILVRIGKGNFKISDYKIAKGLDLASVRKRIKENSKKASNAGRMLSRKLGQSATNFIQKIVRPAYGHIKALAFDRVKALSKVKPTIFPLDGGEPGTSTGTVISTPPKDPLIPLTGAIPYNRENPKSPLFFHGNSDFKNEVSPENESTHEGSSTEFAMGSVYKLTRKTETSPKKAPTKPIVSPTSSDTPGGISICKDFIQNQPIYVELDNEYELEKERRRKALRDARMQERELRRRSVSDFQPSFTNSPQNEQKSRGLSL